MHQRFLLSLPLVLFTTACVFSSSGTSNESLPFAFEKVPLYGQFPTLTDFKFLPESSDFLALNRIGKIGYFRMGGGKATLLADFTIPNVMVEGDCGASSIQLDPFFEQNRFFYVGYCTSMQDNKVSRFTFDPQYFNAVLLSEAEVISTAEPRAVRPVHGVGSINFDVDGAMLIHFGEKGITTNAQDPQSPLGKIVRIVPNRDPNGSGYDIPSDNPFLGGEGNPMLYASGFRNPWRGAYGASGAYWIADVGSSKAEEVNVLKPGANYGWPRNEGSCIEECDQYTDPIVSYDHTMDHAYVRDDASATSSKFRTVWVCSGPDSRRSDPYKSSLRSDIIFGDMFAGWIRGLSLGDGDVVTQDVPLGHLPFVVSCQQNKDGYLYFGTMFTATKVDQDGNPSFSDPSQLNAALWRMVVPSSPIDEIE